MYMSEIISQSVQTGNAPVSKPLSLLRSGKAKIALRQSREREIAMNSSYVVLLTIVFSLMLLLIQRTEAKRRLIIAILMAATGLLIQRYIAYREITSEANLSLALALVFNILFWLFIGRYNPVGSSDDIHVIGMDE
jgi:hypothetical protein